MKANTQAGFFFKEDKEDPLMLKYNLGVSSQVDIFSWKDRMAEKILPPIPDSLVFSRKGFTNQFASQPNHLCPQLMKKEQLFHYLRENKIF